VQLPLTSVADSGHGDPGDHWPRARCSCRHSYARIVITEAGNDPKVSGLVYVAAFARAGQSIATLNASVLSPIAAQLSLNAGFLEH